MKSYTYLTIIQFSYKRQVSTHPPNSPVQDIQNKTWSSEKITPDFVFSWMDVLYRTFSWSSSHIESSGWLLCLSVDHSELKYWDVVSENKSLMEGFNKRKAKFETFVKLGLSPPGVIVT